MNPRQEANDITQKISASVVEVAKLKSQLSSYEVRRFQDGTEFTDTDAFGVPAYGAWLTLLADWQQVHASSTLSVEKVLFAFGHFIERCWLRLDKYLVDGSPQTGVTLRFGGVHQMYGVKSMYQFRKVANPVNIIARVQNDASTQANFLEATRTLRRHFNWLIRTVLSLQLVTRISDASFRSYDVIAFQHLADSYIDAYMSVCHIGKAHATPASDFQAITPLLLVLQGYFLVVLGLQVEGNRQAFLTRTRMASSGFDTFAAGAIARLQRSLLFKIVNSA
jgi:hypothetical protein